MTSLRNLCLLFTMALLSNSALAAKKYDIELIIFERTLKDAALSENWPDDPGTPDLRSAIRLSSKSKKGNYIRLAKSHRTLTSEARRISRASGKPKRLLHLVWRQSAMKRKKAKPVYVAGSSKTGAVKGTVKVSVNRYLHVDLDLLLSSPSGFGSGLYRMQAHRRMRSGELHYLDHPVMGALIKIIPYEPQKQVQTTIITPSAQ